MSMSGEPDDYDEFGMLGDNAAVIRCRGQGEGDFEGKHFKDDQALMQVCARIRGEWKVVTEQATANKP